MKEYVLARYGLPFIIQNPQLGPNGQIAGPSSGFVCSGLLTLDQPIPEDIKEGYYHLPANAVAEGSEEGWYRIEWLNTTQGHVRERIELPTMHDWLGRPDIG